MLPNRPDKQKTTLHPAPNRCARATDSVFAYLDGEMNPKEKAEFEAHLDACPACRQEVALCRTAERALGAGAGAIPPAGDLRPTFYARLAAEQQKQRRPLWIGWKAAVPALAMTLIAVTLLRLNRQPLPTTHPESQTTQTASTTPVSGTPDRMEKTHNLNLQNLAALSRKEKRPVKDRMAIARIDPERVKAAVRSYKKRHLVKNDAEKHQPDVTTGTNQPVTSFDARAKQDTPMNLAYNEPAAKPYREERATALSPASGAKYSVERLSAASAPGALFDGNIPRFRAQNLGSSLAASADTKSDAHVVTASVQTEVNLHVSDEIRGFMSSTRISNATAKHEGQPVLSIEAEDAGPMPAELPALP